MKTVLAEKPRIVPVTDPAEIAAIGLIGRMGINGFQDLNGNFWAYTYDVERWRKRRGNREGAEP